MIKKDELEQLPFRYRLLIRILMKLPNPHLPFLILTKFPEFEGILWAVIVPTFLVLYTFLNILFVVPFLSLHFGFPLNLILGFIIPASIFVFFLRIEIERVINWWRSINEPPKDWLISEKVEELIKTFEKQQENKKP